MSHEFFERLSSDSEDESSEEVEVRVEDRIDPKWYAPEVTNEGEAEAKDVVAGDVKSRNEIQRACDTFSLSIDDSFMADALAAFKKMKKLSQNHVRKYREFPDLLLELINDTPDLKELLEGKTRQSFASGKDFDSLKELVPAFEEFAAWAETTAKSFQEVESEESDTEERETSEEDYIKRMKELVDNRRKKCGDFEKIANGCRRQGYVALQLTSLSLAADTLLESSRSAPTASNIQKCLALVNKLFDAIEANRNVPVSEDSSEITSRKASLVGGISELLYKIYYNILRFAQTFTSNTTQYNDVPLLENDLVDITDAAIGYYKARNNRRAEWRCYTILLDVLGPRRQGGHDILFPMMKRKTRNIVVSSVLESIRALYSVLSNDVEYKNKAICYIAYQLALSGKYREGRDFILRSGLVTYLEESDITEQVPLAILYNKALAQIGLSAFSLGDIDQSYYIFRRLWAVEHQEVQLGQSVPQRRLVADDDELLNFRDNILPLHFRIPGSHMELAALLSALVIDTLNEAKNPFERKNRCKFFHRAVGKGDSLGSTWYTTPVQDRIAAAYKALKVGDFERAKQSVEGIAAWESLPNSAEVLERYLSHLKETALCIFCLNNRSSFSTFSVAQLAAKYDLDEAKVRVFLNRIISDGSTLIAYWDHNDKFLHVDPNNLTHLQHLVIGTAGSVSALGPYAERRVRQAQDYQGRGRGRGRGGRGGGGRGRN